MSDSNLDVALVAGLGAGVYLFFKGFRVYRELRVIADTPEIPIRSMPMGLVHIHGKAVGDELVTSPVSGTPCFFYKVDIEKWKADSKGGGSWSHYKTDTDGVKFYLQDATGKVLVDAHLAEYDLIQSAKRETGSLGLGIGKLLSGMGGPALTTKPGEIGRLLSGMENPALTAKAPKIEQLLSRMGKPALTAGAGATDDSLIAYAQSVVWTAGGGSSVFTSLGQVGGVKLDLGGGTRAFGGGLPTLGPLKRLNVKIDIDMSGGGDSSRRYRFTEYCILPDHWYDVTGTCVENPAPKDAHDRNMIEKGQNEPTFLISWRAEKEIEKTLRKRAVLYVFGGAALSVACLGILLNKFGWL